MVVLPALPRSGQLIALRVGPILSKDQPYDVWEGRPAPLRVNGPESAVSPPGWKWLETGIVSGDVLVPGSDAREHVFYFVRADRDGLMTRRLLSYTADRCA